MKKNKIFEIYQKILIFAKTKLQILTNAFDQFDKENPVTSQNIQLSFIYFFALIDLVYSILNNIFILKFFPEGINPILDSFESLLRSPFLQVWASPEKVFFMSYVVLEFMLVRSTLKLSKFVKFNILLVFAILMLQNLTVSVCDLMFNHDIIGAVASSNEEDDMVISPNKAIAGFFYFIIFVIFLIIYSFFYVNARKRKIVKISGFNWIIDSVAFWLRIKTLQSKK